MPDDRDEGFYRAFEDRFRGTRGEIKRRLKIYIPFVEALKAVDPVPAVLDIGCGRGEWLELLTENGFDPLGIDIDDGMLEAAQSRGFKTIKRDAVSYLQGLAAESLFVVSGFHVVEHLKFSDLQVVVREALRVLKPGGLLILETPNPENLRVGTSNFYVDPTHMSPLPMQLLSFLAEYRGFSRTKILRLQERGALEGAEQITLSDVLSGVSPDYAVVAQKGGNQTAIVAMDAACGREYGLSLDTLVARFDIGVSHVKQIFAAELAQKAATIAALQGETSKLNDRIAEQHIRIVQLGCSIAESQAATDRARNQLDAILSSRSWRLTGPLRALRRWTLR